MMRKDALAKLTELILPEKRILLSTHVRPDGDGLGTEAALARILTTLGLQVEIWNHDPVPSGYEFLFEELTLRDPDDPPSDGAYDVFFCLDVSVPQRLGLVNAYLQQQQLFTVILDHHLEPNTNGNLLFTDPTAAATGEVLYRIARDLNWPVDQPTAAALWVALHTDTGGFRFSNTTTRTLQVARELLTSDIDPSSLCERVYQNRRPESLRLLGRALCQVELLEQDRLALMHVDEQIYRETKAGPDDTESFVNLLLQIQGVEAAVFVYPAADGQTKVSLRGNRGRSIHSLAKALGGGGHAQAAGATLTITIPETVELVRQAGQELFIKPEDKQD